MKHRVPVFCVLEEDMLASDAEDWLLVANGDEFNAKTVCDDVIAQNGGLQC